jgi:hypothetical protein
MSRVKDCPVEYLSQVVQHTAVAVSPQLLMTLCARVSPEHKDPATGRWQVRDREIIALEARILAKTDRDGHWKGCSA